MAKYGVNYYGASKYGATPKLAYSVEPMSVLVQDFSKIALFWQSPKGNFTKIRLVRNQAGYPETAQDGIIIFEENATEGTVSRSSFIDGLDNPTDVPFVQGRQVYYRVFLFTAEKVWVVAGSITAIAPSNHDIHDKFMSSLPRVYTSKEQSPLGAVDTSSALYEFVFGLTFAQEEFQTLLDLLRPRHSGLETPNQLIAIETQNVGLNQEPGLPVKSQKRLVREALYLYSHKGTKPAVETYAEALTGFAPTITVAPNALLTIQDSTFYNSIGNWQTNACTLEASTTLVPVLTDYVIDTTYSGKVTAVGAAYITLGADAPITKGIPIIEDTDYTFSYKVKSPSSAGSTQMTVVWYDKDGVTLGSNFVMTSVSANNTWKTSWQNTTSPVGAVYASLKITFSASGVYYVDQVYAEQGLNTDNTSYQEARAVDIFLNPTLTNYIKNPSFEVNVTDSWTASGSATVTKDSNVSSEAYTGTSSAKIVATGNWKFTSNAVPISGGAYYTISSLIKTTAPLTVKLIGRDNLGVLTGASETYTFSSQTDWARISATKLTDSTDTATVTYDVEFSGGTGTFYLDAVLFEKSQKPTDYFDGSLPSSYGVVWEGTADNSYSHLYVNKPQKVPRLAQTISDWLPSNTWWRVLTYEGVEYTNLTV